MPKFVDLTGMRFGTVTVLRRAKGSRNRSAIWHCRCDCGHEYITTTTAVKKTQTCKRCTGLFDLTGRRFGKLVVISRFYDEAGKHMWRCRCDCGNYINYTPHILNAGSAHSCKRCIKTTFLIEDGVGIGITENGDRFMFDLDLWNSVTKRNWRVDSGGYVRSGSKANRLLLHQLVLGAKENCEIDHINRDKSDCRRENLRFATHAENMANKTARVDNRSTGHKNVYLHRGRYEITIMRGGRFYHGGSYSNFEKAVEAANRKRRELFGEFAYYDDSFDQLTTG